VPFYFCNIFIKPISLLLLLAHMHFNKFPIMCTFHIIINSK